MPKLGIEMKRVLFICALLAGAILFVVLLRSSNPRAPQFKPLQAPPLLTPSNHISYDFLNPRPFEGGEMWIHAASSRTNFENFLYDVDGRRVLGRLTNGFPVARIDRSKVLCAQPVSGATSLKERFFELVRRISRGRVRLARPTSDYSNEPHSYWLLDLENGSTARMGELPERPPFTFQRSAASAPSCYSWLVSRSTVNGASWCLARASWTNDISGCIGGRTDLSGSVSCCCFY